MPFPYKGFREWIAEEEKLGNVVKVESLKCGDYNNIVEIGNGIPGKAPESEIRAFTRYLHSLPGNPIGLIEKPINNRPDIPVVINAWPTRERVERSCGCETRDEMCQKLLANPITEDYEQEVSEA